MAAKSAARAALVSDPATLGDAARWFETVLPDLTVPLADLDPAFLAPTLSSHVAALAMRYGWAGKISLRFAPTDFRRVRFFPATTHYYTCVVRVIGNRECEILLNSSLFEVGNLRLLVGRLPVLVWLFCEALEREPNLVGDFPCLLGDPSFWPVVSFSACDEGACLIPDPDFFASGGYQQFRDLMVDATSWELRHPAVFWRGSTTGIKRYWPPSGPADSGWLPRLDLCARAQAANLADLCDIGITAVVQVPAGDEASIGEAVASFRRPRVEKQAFSRFKAVIDIDGNSNAWSGLFTSLLTGACVLKVDSEHSFRQWYYDRLEPGVHYVPVNADLSDFDDKVRFVRENDDIARSIGEAGRDFARSVNFEQEMSAASDRLISWSRARAIDGGRWRADRGS